MPSRPSPGSDPGPVQVPYWVPSGPVQIRHVLCFAVFRTHPGPEVGAIPARPGPILVPSVSPRIGPGRAETDFLATSEIWPLSAATVKSQPATWSCDFPISSWPGLRLTNLEVLLTCRVLVCNSGARAQI